MNKQKTEKIKLAFDRVFKSKDGETILYTLGSACLSEVGEYEPDSYKMAFKEGQRNMLFRILRISGIDIQTLLKKYEIMEKEEILWTQ